MKSVIITLFCFAAAALPSSAKIVTESVHYEQGGAHLIGYLAYDDQIVTGSEKVPGVLVVPEWWGLNDYAKSRARQVAELGYVAFAVDMYGDGASTLEVEKAKAFAGQFYGKPLMAERARAALDQLLANPHVDAARVAAIGYCFGGSTVQALAFSGAPIAGIVSFHGGLIPVPADAAEKTKAKLLFCHGAIDPFVSKEEVDGFLKALNDDKLDFQFNSYSGAIHAFTNPKSDEVAAKTGLKGIGYNAAADHRSWAAMLDFFGEIFGKRP
jgi:dienelactone hydrolase